MYMTWSQHDTFFYLYVCKHACAHKIYDIKPIVQSTRVNIRHMHDTLQRHVCMSGTYIPNLVSVYLGMHANGKPGIQ